MKELIKITNSNAAGNWSFTEFFPCMPMTWQAGYGHRDTQHSIWQEAKTQSILKGKTRNEIGDASASCYQVLPPTLSSPAYITITNKYAWARHHIQNHGSLLSTLQAPNHWFLYPITLQKRKYYLATTAEDPQTHPAEMHWDYQWKELSPSKNFSSLSIRLLISLRKLCFLLQNALGRTLTLLTSTMPEHSRNQTYFNSMFTKERDMYKFIP